MNKTEKKPADVWPFCANCPQREICDEARRYNAPYHVLSYCADALVLSLAIKYQAGDLFLFPEGLVREIFRATEQISGASGALRRLAYIQEDTGPAMVAPIEKKPNDSRR